MDYVWENGYDKYEVKSILNPDLNAKVLRQTKRLPSPAPLYCIAEMRILAYASAGPRYMTGTAQWNM
jgi:hypothetical protein